MAAKRCVSTIMLKHADACIYNVVFWLSLFLTWGTKHASFDKIWDLLTKTEKKYAVLPALTSVIAVRTGNWGPWRSVHLGRCRRSWHWTSLFLSGWRVLNMCGQTIGRWSGQLGSVISRRRPNWCWVYSHMRGIPQVRLHDSHWPGRRVLRFIWLLRLFSSSSEVWNLVCAQ